MEKNVDMHKFKEAYCEIFGITVGIIFQATKQEKKMEALIYTKSSHKREPLKSQQEKSKAQEKILHGRDTKS